ncbi:LOW QUALITY PROTEIN: membrane-spanning 4-domains subfamily A member 3-like [Erethizon dorsatum]
MASQEVYSGKVGTALAGSGPGSQVKPESMNNSVYQPADGPQDHQKGILQALGATQIMIGAVILALGVFLGSLELLSPLRHAFFLTFYTGYPFRGSVLFISSGSLSVAAGRKPTKIRMQNSFGMNVARATIAVLGVVFLSVHLAIRSLSLKDCQSLRTLDSCVDLGASSNPSVVSLLCPPRQRKVHILCSWVAGGIGLQERARAVLGQQ